MRPYRPRRPPPRHGVNHSANVPPPACCVVEDSKPGVAAGLAAGMEVIAITNTHSAEELHHATHVVSTYQEIEHLLLGAR